MTRLVVESVALGMAVISVPFVVVAMMCVFGGMGHAPLAMMLIVGEITGRYALACRDSGGRVKRVEARSWVIVYLSHQKWDS
jgi:hypothetical protein